MVIPIFVFISQYTDRNRRSFCKNNAEISYGKTFLTTINSAFVL